MSDDTLLTVGILAVTGLVAYKLYSNWKNTIPERTDVIVADSTLTPNANILTYKDTAYKFNESDWSKLNLAQRILYSIGISPRLIFE